MGDQIANKLEDATDKEVSRIIEEILSSDKNLQLIESSILSEKPRESDLEIETKQTIEKVCAESSIDHKQEMDSASYTKVSNLVKDFEKANDKFGHILPSSTIESQRKKDDESPLKRDYKEEDKESDREEVVSVKQEENLDTEKVKLLQEDIETQLNKIQDLLGLKDKQDADDETLDTSSSVDDKKVKQANDEFLKISGGKKTNKEGKLGKDSHSIDEMARSMEMDNARTHLDKTVDLFDTSARSALQGDVDSVGNIIDNISIVERPSEQIDKAVFDAFDKDIADEPKQDASVTRDLIFDIVDKKEIVEEPRHKDEVVRTLVRDVIDKKDIVEEPIHEGARAVHELITNVFDKKDVVEEPKHKSDKAAYDVIEKKNTPEEPKQDDKAFLDLIPDAIDKDDVVEEPKHQGDKVVRDGVPKACASSIIDLTPQISGGIVTSTKADDLVVTDDHIKEDDTILRVDMVTETCQKVITTMLTDDTEEDAKTAEVDKVETENKEVHQETVYPSDEKLVDFDDQEKLSDVGPVIHEEVKDTPSSDFEPKIEEKYVKEVAKEDDNSFTNLEADKNIVSGNDDFFKHVMETVEEKARKLEETIEEIVTGVPKTQPPPVPPKTKSIDRSEQSFDENIKFLQKPIETKRIEIKKVELDDEPTKKYSEEKEIIYKTNETDNKSDLKSTEKALAPQVQPITNVHEKASVNIVAESPKLEESVAPNESTIKVSEIVTKVKKTVEEFVNISGDVKESPVSVEVTPKSEVIVPAPMKETLVKRESAEKSIEVETSEIKTKQAERNSETKVECAQARPCGEKKSDTLRSRNGNNGQAAPRRRCTIL